MNINILGTESLGVRGLACSIRLKNRKIFIDPGIALGWSRHGFLPHPFQAAVGIGIKKLIIEELKDSDDIIFSHFDGDHCPLADPNPYQLGIDEIKQSLSKCRIWIKNPENSPPMQHHRLENIKKSLNLNPHVAEGIITGPMAFSYSVPHGQRKEKSNRVMMSRIEEDGICFVHASDNQLLDSPTISKILSWKPDIVLLSGPPLYHFTSKSHNPLKQRAWMNALSLSEKVDTLILDHHLLRSEEGVKWLEKLKAKAHHNVMCAAEFMKRDPIFLEAWRSDLYRLLPVPQNWHDEYEKGAVNTDQYRIKGWEILINNGKIKPCKWYSSCPIKYYTDEKKLDRYWIENFCLVNRNSCIRYQMEENGEPHPDNMLPNGEISENLTREF